MISYSLRLIDYLNKGYSINLVQNLIENKIKYYKELVKIKLSQKMFYLSFFLKQNILNPTKFKTDNNSIEILIVFLY